jgi:hypothetical protein
MVKGAAFPVTSASSMLLRDADELERLCLLCLRLLCLDIDDGVGSRDFGGRVVMKRKKSSVSPRPIKLFLRCRLAFSHRRRRQVTAVIAISFLMAYAALITSFEPANCENDVYLAHQAACRLKEGANTKFVRAKTKRKFFKNNAKQNGSNHNRAKKIPRERLRGARACDCSKQSSGRV